LTIIFPLAGPESDFDGPKQLLGYNAWRKSLILSRFGQIAAELKSVMHGYAYLADAEHLLAIVKYANGLTLNTDINNLSVYCIQLIEN